MSTDRKRRIEFPFQDDGDDHHGDEERPQIRIVTLWIVRNLLVARNRHMQMAAAFVYGVKRRDEGTVLLARTA